MLAPPKLPAQADKITLSWTRENAAMLEKLSASFGKDLVPAFKTIFVDSHSLQR